MHVILRRCGPSCACKIVLQHDLPEEISDVPQCANACGRWWARYVSYRWSTLEHTVVPCVGSPRRTSAKLWLRCPNGVLRV